MAALTWAQICQWNEGYFLDAADDMRLLRAKALQAQEDMESAQRGFVSQGETANAIRRHVDRLIGRLSGRVQVCSDVMMALADAADGAWSVRTKISDCQQYAEQTGVVLDSHTGEVDENTVELAAQAGSEVEYRALYGPIQARRSAAAALRSMVEETLTLAQEVHDDLVTSLKKLGDLDPDDRRRQGSTTHSPGLPNLPKKDWSVTETAMWWSALSDKDKQWLVDYHPEVIGNRDGVEFAWREKANRKVLDRLIEEYEQKYAAGEKFIDDMSPHPYRDLALTQEHRELYQAAKVAEETLSHLYTIRRSLDNTADSHLITLDMSGHSPKAAIALGDMDKADHIGIFVPGMGTRVNDSMEGYVSNVEDLADKAEKALQKAGKSGSVVTVAWLGYDAPAALGEDNFYKVAGTGAAEAGAERLKSFTEGIEATQRHHSGHDGHLTVLGHSYGSTTSGLATATVKHGVVDDLVLFGSPGSGVQSVSEYNLTSGTPYVSAVPWNLFGDIVQGIGTDANFGKNPEYMPDFTHLSNDSPGGSLWWPPFIGRHGTDTYMHKDSQILQDMAAVVTGTYQGAKP